MKNEIDSNLFEKEEFFKWIIFLKENKKEKEMIKKSIKIFDSYLTKEDKKNEIYLKVKKNFKNLNIKIKDCT